VGKPKNGGSGFSAAKSASTPKQSATRAPAPHAAKEQEAVELINQGKHQEAEAIYRELIAEGTSNHIVYGNLAAICGMQGRLDDAVTLLRKSLDLEPRNPDAHNNLGLALKKQNKPVEAIKCYKKALSLKQCFPAAHLNLGIIFKEQGNLKAAISACQTSIGLKPDDPEAYLHLGDSLKANGNLNEAIKAYEDALKIKADHIIALHNLGVVLHESGDLDTAIRRLQRALEIQKDIPEIFFSLGNTFAEAGDTDAAINSYRKGLELSPEHPVALFNLSMTELLQGDWQTGWKNYEVRFQTEQGKGFLICIPLGKKCTRTNLLGAENLLVVSEQGLGDTLQFMRYATALRNQDISVSFCAPPKLHTLIQASGIDPSPLTPEQANQFAEGHWIPLLSVPRYLEVSPENPIITEPYIKTTDDLIAKWEDILSAEQRPIIGINWQGDPSHEKTNSIGRSLPLETFAPIAAKTNASLLSLQKGFGSEQLKTSSFRDHFVSCQEQVNDTWDFLETAAIIVNCDLVITSDTSVAHLAGGMGKTTWLLLKKVPEWRWGLEGETTFWYPSMRLFRQRERGDWNEVMARVAEALQEHFGNGSVTTQPAAAPQPLIKPEPIQDIQAPISLGELIDKITILQIKTQHLQNSALENVKKELEALETTLNNLLLNIDPTLIQCLKKINQDLWNPLCQESWRLSISTTFSTRGLDGAEQCAATARPSKLM